MKFATSVLAAEAAVIVLEFVALSRANGRIRWAAVAVTSVGENDATVEALGNVNVRSAWERKALATTRIVIDDDVGH